jgi:hypothetical protein
VTINVVTVTIAASNSPIDLATAEGYVIAVPDGVQWPDGSNDPVVPMMQQAHLLNGTATLQLVASDNYAAGVLTWDFIANIRSFPTVNVQQVPVNFSLGANQNLWTILAAAGWTG